MILMGLITAAGAALTVGFVSHQPALLVVSLVVVTGVLAAPFIQHAGAKRKARWANQELLRNYLEHLADRGRQAREAVEARRKYLESGHPAPDQLMSWISRGEVWQRRSVDRDFADIALGVSDVPSGLTIRQGADDKLTIALFTGLKAQATAIADAARTIKDAPFVLSLAEDAVLSIEGPHVEEPRAHVLGLARALLLELLVCCGPDELLLLVAAPPATVHEWNWLMQVPHAVESDGSGKAAIATSGPELSRALGRLVGPRLEILRNRDQSEIKKLPRLVIVLDAFLEGSELAQVALLSRTLASAASIGVAVLLVTDSPGASPADAAAVVNVLPNRRAMARLIRRGQSVAFDAVSAPAPLAEEVARQLSLRRLDTDVPPDDEAMNRPLLDLMGLRPLPDPRTLWRRLPKEDLLRATIGVTPDSAEYTLDLKESGIGPHGLLVGASGSGKSQLLRSLVAALALAHSPEQLQMAFIDFKGGSALKALANLPHSAGVITNIGENPTLIDRMRESLPAEIEARERLLASVGREDISGYWALRESRPELPAMPYLLVIIDEFGRLLEHDVGFLEKLLEAGRVGRSLGVHLMLSSQRVEGHAAGLARHARYRIALRTDNPDDSLSAIDVRDAAALPPRGYGYLKADGTLQRFRVAAVGVSDDGAETDLDRVIRGLSAVGKGPQLWLDPLPDTADGEFLPLDDARLGVGRARPDGGLPVSVGLWDDPSRRLQGAAVIDTAQAGGNLAVVGKPGSGKSAALLAQVLQAARFYDAGRLRFFVIDGGDRISAASSLPNVAGYATVQDEDRVTRIATEMLSLLEERARTRSTAGSTWQAGMADPEWPRTVLIIDNYAAFHDRYADLDPVVERVLMEGSGFGLHVHLSSVRWAEISERKLQRITMRVELSLGDPADSRYAPAKASAITNSGPGRGLGPGSVQWQFAAPLLQACQLPSADDGMASADGVPRGGRRTVSIPDSLVRMTAAAVAGQAGETWPGASAPPLLLLKDLSDIHFGTIVGTAPPGTGVLGVDEDGFQPVLFTPGSSGNLLVQGGLPVGREVLTRLLRQVGSRADVYLVDFRGDLTRSLGLTIGPTARTPDDVESIVDQLRRILDERFAAHRESAPGRGDSQPVVLVIDSYESVQEHTASGHGKLRLADLSQYLLVSDHLSFSVVINKRQIGGTDPFFQRVMSSEAGVMQVRFGTEPAASVISGVRHRRTLGRGVAELSRPGYPDTLIQAVHPGG